MCLIALGEEASEDEISEAIKRADKNGDGRISFEEFPNLMYDNLMKYLGSKNQFRPKSTLI